MGSMSRTVEEGVALWKCHLCERSSKDKSIMRHHIETHFPDLDGLIAQSMRAVVDDFGSRVWKCEVCSKTNKDKTNIRKHVETHFEGFEHHCPLCGKQSKSREAMRKHMSNYHKS